MTWLIFHLFTACGGDKNNDTGESDSPVEEEIFILDAGTYSVLSAQTLPNDCGADWSEMNGRDLNVQVGEFSVIIEGIFMDLSGNDLSSVEEDERNWADVGLDCESKTVIEYSGKLKSDSSLTWTWEHNLEMVAGSECAQAFGHELPCTYVGVFELEKSGN